MFNRWRVFPREIESNLALYYQIDIGDWFEGKVSSRKLLTLLDGLPAESWYKQSTERFVNEMREEQKNRFSRDVKGLIFAQLTGQTVSGPE